MLKYFSLSSLPLVSNKKRQLNELFALHRRVVKAYLLKETLERLWASTADGAMLRYLQSWIDQLRWQRLKPMEKLARMLLNHVEGILNYCRTKGSHGGGGSSQWKHQSSTASWSRLPRS